MRVRWSAHSSSECVMVTQAGPHSFSSLRPTTLFVWSSAVEPAGSASPAKYCWFLLPLPQISEYLPTEFQAYKKHKHIYYHYFVGDYTAILWYLKLNYQKRSWKSLILNSYGQRFPVVGICFLRIRVKLSTFISSQDNYQVWAPALGTSMNPQSPCNKSSLFLGFNCSHWIHKSATGSSNQKVFAESITP